VGFALACYCDVRFAVQGAKLTTAHGRLGLPAEFGLSWLLPRLIGASRAADLLLSSRIVLAEEAHEMGLVSRVAASGALDGVVADYVATLANEVAPGSIAATKRQLYLDLHRGVVESIADADRLLRSMMASDEFVEGVAALAERRPPRF
jgi:enoyl-CoA hydratase/carnithine racemase